MTASSRPGRSDLDPRALVVYVRTSVHADQAMVWQDLNVPAEISDAHAGLRAAIDQLAGPAPKVAERLQAMEDDLLAYTAFTPVHWSKIWSNTRYRLTGDGGRRCDSHRLYSEPSAALDTVARRARRARRSADGRLHVLAHAGPRRLPAIARNRRGMSSTTRRGRMLALMPLCGRAR